MKGEERSGRIIKAKRLKDGFTFQLSVDHIIEQVSKNCPFLRLFSFTALCTVHFTDL